MSGHTNYNLKIRKIEQVQNVKYKVSILTENGKWKLIYNDKLGQQNISPKS